MVFGLTSAFSTVYSAATGTVSGGSIISRFQTLISYMRDDPASFPNVVPPANQGNIVTWVQWLKANWAKGYRIYNWMQKKGWLNSPIGAFFEEMAGNTGSTVMKMAPWLATQNAERVTDTTLLTGDVIQLTPSNLEKLRATTKKAMEWWTSRAKSKQMGTQYLNTIVRNMAPLDAKDYKVPTFYNPYDENDDSGIWWKFMKDTGWNSIISKAANLSFVEGQKEKQRLLIEAARWQTVSKTLGWISMTEPLIKFQKQAGVFYTKWTETDQRFKNINDLLSKSPALQSKYGAKVNALQGQAQDIAIDAYQKIQPFGMWPGSQPQSLGAALTLVKAGIAVGALAALGIIIMYTNSLIGIFDEAGRMERDMLAELGTDLKDELIRINEEQDILKQQLKNGIINQAQFDDQFNKLQAFKAGVNDQRQKIAAQAGKTGVLGKVAVAGMVGVAGIIAWKTL